MLKCLKSVVFDFHTMEMALKCDAFRLGVVLLVLPAAVKMKTTFMTILNIIYMFDDCRSVFTCSPAHSLIKLHAFFLEKEKKKQRLLFRFLYELHFIVSFEMRFCVCRVQARNSERGAHTEWPFLISRCTQRQHFILQMEREQFGCFGKWATEIFQNKSRTHTLCRRKWTFITIIMPSYFHYSESECCCLLLPLPLSTQLRFFYIFHFDVGSRRKSILIFISYVLLLSVVFLSILCLRLLLAISFIQLIIFFLLPKSQRK